MVTQRCDTCGHVTEVDRLTWCPVCGHLTSEVEDPIRADELGSMSELEPRAPWWMRTANRVMAAILRRTP